MKKTAAVLLSLLFVVLLLCSCRKKETAFYPETVYLGDAWSNSEGETSVAEDTDGSWATFQFQAGQAVLSDGSKDAGDAFLRNVEEEVIRYINEERAKAGLPALMLDEQVMAAAEIRAKEQKAAFSHVRPDGRTCDTVYDDLRIPIIYYGENLGMGGTSDAKNIVVSWMASPAHMANIMTPQYTKTGVGCFSSGGVIYWSQLFISN